MSKKIIRIEEEGLGTIGLAENYKSAVAYLIKEGWLFDELQVYDGREENWKPMYIVYGDNWCEVMMNEWNIDDFADAFDGWLYLSENEVYSINEDAD